MGENHERIIQDPINVIKNHNGQRSASREYWSNVYSRRVQEYIQGRGIQIKSRQGA